MNEHEAIPSSSPPRRQPWNKGKLIGAKPPLRASHVWSIRTKLQLEGRTRDLALFNFAIDSKLRGCDVVAARVTDVAPNGYTLDRATVRAACSANSASRARLAASRSAHAGQTCLVHGHPGGAPPGDFGVFGCGAKLLQHRLLGGGGGTLALLVVRVLEAAHLFSGSSRPAAEWSRPSGSRHIEVSVVMETSFFLALFSISATPLP